MPHPDPVIREKWGAKKWGTFRWGGTSFANINGTLYETYDMEISDLLNNEINTASFGVINTYANKPVAGHTVYIVHNNITIFSGRVETVESDNLDGTSFMFYLTCVDYQIDLDRKVVAEAYTSETIANIISDIISNYVTGITTTNVQDPGTTLDAITFNYLTVSECMTKLADIIGWHWYVDYDKDLHFFPQATEDAPVELLDNGTDFDELSITPEDMSQMANRVIVRGGYYLAALYPQDPITATAGQTEFATKYKPFSPFTVTVDTVAKTVGIQYIDAPGSHDFLLNAVEKLLLADTIVMSGGEVVQLQYKPEIPLIVQVDDYPSQQRMKDILGVATTEEAVIEKPVIDETINDIEVARDLGRSELLKYANPIVRGSFTTTEDGWRSGQRLHIDLTDRNIDEYYMVQSVQIRPLGPATLLYTVEFASTLLGFNWFLMKLLDRSKEITERDDEVLDKLKVVTGEEFILSHAAPVLTLQTPPFEYGAGGSPQGIYDEAEYS